MGEPLHNVENVVKAANILVDEQGLQFSPRKVTVSTSGLVPQLRRFLRESNCSIAVSLNATTDEVIVPSLSINSSLYIYQFLLFYVLHLIFLCFFLPLLQILSPFLSIFITFILQVFFV